MKIGSNKAVGEYRVARKETIIYDDEKVICFNLSDFVGTGERNEKGDVMLVQAMFSFIAGATGGLSKLGLRSRADLPGVTGVFGGDTGFLISSFQLKWMQILTAQHVGMLFPGYYKEKILAMGPGDRRQAMFLLHQFAQESAALLNKTDYTSTMLSEFPELSGNIR
jgi:hypothetical protein